MTTEELLAKYQQLYKDADDEIHRIRREVKEKQLGIGAEFITPFFEGRRAAFGMIVDDLGGEVPED